MQTKVAPPVETATWLQIKDDKIAAIRTLFDTRGAAPPTAEATLAQVCDRRPSRCD